MFTEFLLTFSKLWTQVQLVMVFLLEFSKTVSSFSHRMFVFIFSKLWTRIQLVVEFLSIFVKFFKCLIGLQTFFRFRDQNSFQNSQVHFQKFIAIFCHHSFVCFFLFPMSSPSHSGQNQVSCLYLIFIVILGKPWFILLSNKNE